MHMRRIGSSAVIIAVTMGGARLAPAAEAGSSDESALPRGLISEVVVTARKRGDERLQEIPTAISAFSEQALQDMGVNEFTDFAYQAMENLAFTTLDADALQVERFGGLLVGEPGGLDFTLLDGQRTDVVSTQRHR